MAIIRSEKKENGRTFFIMDKEPINDSNISYKAKGILAYLLSKQDNWRININDLVKHSKDGKDSVLSGLRELKENGYIIKRPIKNEMGKINKWEELIFEISSEDAKEIFEKQNSKKNSKKIFKSHNSINTNYENRNILENSHDSLESICEVAKVWNIKIDKLFIKKLLVTYKYEDICRAIATISTKTDIRDYERYIIQVLNKFYINNVVNIERKVESKEKNKIFRNVKDGDYERLEEELLSWYD